MLEKINFTASFQPKDKDFKSIRIEFNDVYSQQFETLYEFLARLLPVAIQQRYQPWITLLVTDGPVWLVACLVSNLCIVSYEQWMLINESSQTLGLPLNGLFRDWYFFIIHWSTLPDWSILLQPLHVCSDEAINCLFTIMSPRSLFL